MKKYIFTALALGMAASAANAEALTVVHKEQLKFGEELNAALAEAGLTADQVTEIKIISAVDENGKAALMSPYDKGSGDNKVLNDWAQLRVALRGSLVKADLSETAFQYGYTGDPDGDDNFMAGMTKIEEVIFSETLTALGGGSFKNCTALKKVVLGDNFKIIGRRAFQGCTSLEYIELPMSLTKISDEAFNEATKFSISQLNEGIQEIGAKAFRKTKVTFTELPSTLTTLGDAAFVNANITEFTIPEFLWSKIPNQAFYVDDANAVRTFTCRSLTAPSAAVDDKNYTGVFGKALAFPNYTLRVLKDAEEAYKAKAPWNTMQIEALSTPVQLEFATDKVSIEHPHHGVVSPGANDIYEGSHEWTITPAKGRYIKAVTLAPDGEAALYADEESNNELFAADPDTDTAELDGKAVKVTVPVGSTPLYLAVVDEAARQIATGIDTVEGGASIVRAGSTIYVSEGTAVLYDLSGNAIACGSTIDLSTLARGIYIVRAAGTTQKITI
ncbi:MAG: leucine-rich repeat domain-containing protein [Muribaculaceae bacterium]|nr:leucine-rich repeat domain-containing protein [Muribaculaceae bacterium]